MEMEVEKKKRSFSYEIGDQKLKLIDISSEEDCLIDSPLFDSLEDLRLSVTLDNINENGGSRTSFQRDKTTKVNQQKELKHLSTASIQPGRPSFLRKSLAWDHAFFTSTGLLDPHELSLVNKEFETLEEHPLPVIVEDVRARTADLQSISDIGTSSRNKIDRRPVSKRKNISNATAERSNTKQTCKRRECNSQALKFPKVPRATRSASSWQSESTPEMYIADLRGKKTTRTGQDLMVSNSTTTRSLSSQKIAHPISSITSCPSYMTSAYARKRRETRKSELSASISSSITPTRSSTKSKSFKNLVSSSMEIHHSYNKPPLSTTCCWFVESPSSTSSTNQAHSDSKFGLNITFGPTQNVSSSSQLTRAVDSVPRENSQPSGLRVPSPKIGFFDEDKSLVPTLDRNLYQTQKQGIATSISKSVEASSKVKRARSSPVEARYAAPLHKVKDASSTASDKRKHIHFEHQTDKSLEIDTKFCSKLRKVGLNSSLSEDERQVIKETLKTKVRSERMVTKAEKAVSTTTITTPRSQSSRGRLYKSSLSMSLHLTPSRDEGISGPSKLREQEHEVNDLSRYMELIDLNDRKEIQLKQRKSFPHKRSPLVENKSVCNRDVVLQSSLLSSKGKDKENN
ncbi:PREDICTED: uncharacterized protein LOC109213840 [Nicotiana attenuata]|uniref:Uncharacterized protein n=1 Tax=Nicotiana attenuata TaxID=49451 RepID=A0A1J6IPX9_NICAT|nr:PREDICTED: uncharacterized protein LOC109213840 [Nicotiana attenuata]OIT06762.1 hypothetical protein A4A49_12309 [Nicotiana attenuata]